MGLMKSTWLTQAKTGVSTIAMGNVNDPMYDWHEKIPGRSNVTRKGVSTYEMSMQKN
jgi:hypothetical protein